MANIRIELNRSGVRQLLQSAEMAACCEEVARGALGKCGPGYEMDSMVGKTRVNAMIYTATAEAADDNLKHNTLAKAVGK